MPKALLSFFRNRPQPAADTEIQAVLALNSRMQRILDCHARLNIEPRVMAQVPSKPERPA